MIDQKDFGNLLGFVSDVAIAIRMNSAYNSEAKDKSYTANDVMWLSDSLHELHHLGDAISKGDLGAVASVCDAQILIYQDYRDKQYGPWKSPPYETFERNERFVSLDRGIAVLTSIRDKALLAQKSSPVVKVRPHQERRP